MIRTSVAWTFGKPFLAQRRKDAKENQRGDINGNEIEDVAREALRPFERRAGENPYTLQRDLQETMQDNVGIVRNEAEMTSQLECLRKFWERASHVGVSGNREFNPGWHTALDLKNLLTVSEAVTRAALVFVRLTPISIRLCRYCT
jgi:succinate dehydrogenase / fumarate reductase flavoprotein subunit